MRYWPAIFLVVFCTICIAADRAPSVATATASDVQSDWDSPEMIPPASQWPGVLVIASLGLFVMAAVIGPVVRAHTPAELPATHSYDEPPGSSHRHGNTGTANP